MVHANDAVPGSHRLAGASDRSVGPLSSFSDRRRRFHEVRKDVIKVHRADAQVFLQLVTLLAIRVISLFSF